MNIISVLEMCKYFDITYCCNPGHVGWRVEECDLGKDAPWGWVDCPNFKQLDVTTVSKPCHSCEQKLDEPAAAATEFGKQNKT
jgi:hypothetical protein